MLYGYQSPVSIRRRTPEGACFALSSSRSARQCASRSCHPEERTPVRVSKDARSSCFETLASLVPQHDRACYPPRAPASARLEVVILRSARQCASRRTLVPHASRHSLRSFLSMTGGSGLIVVGRLPVGEALGGGGLRRGRRRGRARCRVPGSALARVADLIATPPREFLPGERANPTIIRQK